MDAEDEGRSLTLRTCSSSTLWSAGSLSPPPRARLLAPSHKPNGRESTPHRRDRLLRAAGEQRDGRSRPSPTTHVRGSAHRSYSVRPSRSAVVMNACGTSRHASTSAGVQTTTSFAGKTPTRARKWRDERRYRGRFESSTMSRSRSLSGRASPRTRDPKSTIRYGAPTARIRRHNLAEQVGRRRVS